MKKALSLFLLLPALAWSQPGKLGDFDQIVLSGSKDIKIHFGADQSPQINVEPGEWSGLGISQSDGKLTVDLQKELPAEKELEITISKLQKIRLIGSGSIIVDGYKGTDLKVELAGSGDVDLQGECTNLEVAVAGSGNVQAKNLMVQNAKVAIAGSGNAYIHAIGILKISIMGSGDVHYTGKPESLKQAIMGTGSVIAE